MGALIWHQYSRLLSITASVYATWAGFWGLWYRKFFWDFVGGILRDPGGIQPSAQAAPFITVIVKVPIVQMIAMALGLLIVALELPLPQLKHFAIYRSTALRIVMLIFQAFLSILFYQGTNAALWSFIAILCYTRSLILGETIDGVKESRGTEGV